MEKIEIDTISHLVTIGGIVVSAVVSFIVAKIQTDSNKKNIDKQISSEIKKIEYQYKLEQKKDNKNLILRLKVEKINCLLIKINECTREMVKTTTYVTKYVKQNKNYDDEYTITELRKDVNDQQEKVLEINREILALINFNPQHKEIWFEIYTNFGDCCNIIWDGFTYVDKFEKVVPNPSYKNLQSRNNEMAIKSINLQDDLSKDLINLIDSLENG